MVGIPNPDGHGRKHRNIDVPDEPSVESNERDLPSPYVLAAFATIAAGSLYAIWKKHKQGASDVSTD